MKMRVCLFFCVFFGVVPSAISFTIEDNYWGADAHGYGDVISASSQPAHNLFNIQGMDVAFSGGFMDVKVYTGFHEGTSGGYGTLYGDLFISTNGWTPAGTTADFYLSDNAGNGEEWEFVFDTSEKKLFGGDFSIILSQNAPPGNVGYTIRDGQEVYRGDGGVAFEGDGSNVDLTNVATALFDNSHIPDPFPYLAYQISLESLGLFGGETIGLKWGMSCANDTIEGAVTVPTPEPGTVILLGLGLTGLLARARRRAGRD
jgi:hypothetical protein